MAERKPFLSNTAKDVFPPGAEGDFILPVCMPNPNLLIGESLAVILVETVEGQRVGVPFSIEALSGLHELLGEALRLLSAPEGGTVQ
ncbi:hypothetical protein FPV16_25035 [Methylobacterium sp. W2]|uniref:hypothetical protein n=1 Tax=Methylobacterium sp. W2 TaxID=2598107 RepID=UPI001D0C964D|nr:hypothetical protein [Methylobacterium sp. W2]MCC0809423.1 hypothetical protein [Methylobacterium sp. W2]